MLKSREPKDGSVSGDGRVFRRDQSSLIRSTNRPLTPSPLSFLGLLPSAVLSLILISNDQWSIERSSPLCGSGFHTRNCSCDSLVLPTSSVSWSAIKL
ncbi:hypothetical protein IE53DRAFT_388909 [Violaceomyces palustris]|uniref:Uncharacterized protein n=1 Tax=Violaceomyces palustris TaxID=1673888 RepID=A0ACD0NSR4_9BASI|nr:hypothetical protein IE53DRAFT_388909 [Violaceomyces palustris]